MIQMRTHEVDAHVGGDRIRSPRTQSEGISSFVLIGGHLVITGPSPM
jgi:hypothetical protein